MSARGPGDRLRVGVIGLGYAGEAHSIGYRALAEDVELVAIAGLEEGRRASLAQTYGYRYQHGAWEDLVARDDLDIVSVCTPNYLHAPITIAALSSGKHVLCEKPLARTGAEARAMVAAARANDRVLHTAFNWRERGDVQVLRRHIDTGALGRIYHAKATWMRRRGIPSMGSWFTSKEMAGGGPLIDLGVHVLDLALFLMGEPAVTAVSAATYAELGTKGDYGWAPTAKMSVGSTFEVEDLATAFVRLEGGRTLLLEASWATHGSAGDDFGVALFGTDGGAEIKVRNYSVEDTLFIYADVGGTPAEIRPKVGAGEGHRAVTRAFVAAVRAGGGDGHHGEAGLRRAEVIDACYRSAVDGRELPVDVPV